MSQQVLKTSENIGPRSTSEKRATANISLESVGPAVAILPVDIFTEQVLPPLHEIFIQKNLEAISRQLAVKHRGAGNPAYSRRTKRWTAFGSVKEATEHSTYEALATISKQIIAEVEVVLGTKCPKRLFDFVYEADRTVVPDAQTSTSKPDCYFVLREEHRLTKGKPETAAKAKQKVNWTDIGPTAQFKSDNSERAVRNDVARMVQNVTRVMCEDARRRFAFAFTVEATIMHLWYASRADVVMSESFDFMNEPDILIRFFLSILYATEVDAGWDPTMECIWEKSTRQYIITVHDSEQTAHKYKTVETLSTRGAGLLRGPGTRVWKVVPLDPDGGEADICVLKDCWVEQDIEREGNIVDEIVADAEKKVQTWERIVAQHADNSQELPDYPDEVRFTKEDLEKLKRSILMPSIYGDVMLADGVPDKTLDWTNLWRDDDISYNYLWRAVLQRDAPGIHLSGECSTNPLHYEEPRTPAVVHKAKAHHRIVFKEVCRTIKDDEFLDDVYTHLVKTCQALELLHKAGWVHRDISCGNIFISEGDVVKLGDFEFAKRLSCAGDEDADSRTGTPAFMAVEVQETRYLFASRAKKLSSGRRREKSTVKWFYNPIHDLESVKWMALFFTVNTDIQFKLQNDQGDMISAPAATEILLGDTPIDPEPEEARNERITHQYKYARTLFHETTGRRNALDPGDDLSELLHPALVEAELDTLLDDVRERLLQRHQEAEKELFASSITQILAGPNLYRDMALDLTKAAAQVQLIRARVGVTGPVPVRVAVRDLAREVTVSQHAIKPHANQSSPEAPAGSSETSTPRKATTAAPQVQTKRPAPSEAGREPKRRRKR